MISDHFLTDRFQPRSRKKLANTTRNFYDEISARINKDTAAVTKKIEAKRFKFQIGELDLLESLLDFTTPKILDQLTPPKTAFQLLGERLDELTKDVDAKLAEAKADREKQF